MNHRVRVFAVVILTFVIALSFGFLTEYVRQTLVFSWAIEEGDEFIYEVIINEYSTGGSETPLIPFAGMNNSRIRVEIISLPNVSIVFYSSWFLENIVEYTKTSSIFDNGTDIPSGDRLIINRHVSYCMLPIGGWLHLDSFFPNRIHQPGREHESYLSARQGTSFYFGYSANETFEANEWYGIIDIETGVPRVVSFWFYSTSQALTYRYNVTMYQVS
ncbi:MAG: hypothetical protein ACFFBL_03675 [Promethearchaeota archaeon]